MIEEGTHSPLGPSGAHRWMECPGSVELQQKMPKEESSPFAEEGTLAHKMAEEILTSIEPTWEYDVEMKWHVMKYVEEIRSIDKVCDSPIHIEGIVTLHSIDQRMYGTVDAYQYSSENNTLYVTDLKYGKGIEVSAENNPQLMYYALCAMERYKDTEHIILTIVQPRIDNNQIKRTWVDGKEIEVFKNLLIKAVKNVELYPNRYNAGDKQCKWCTASAICPAQSQSFAAITAMDAREEKVIPPIIQEMTLEMVGHVYENRKMLSKWLDDVTNYAQDRLRGGDEVPGAKLVMQRKNRIIKNKDEAKKVLQKKRYRVKDICELKLKSPAKLEAAGIPKSVVDELSIIPNGKLVIAPESDKRVAENVKPFQFDKIEGEK